MVRTVEEEAEGGVLVPPVQQDMEIVSVVEGRQELGLDVAA